MNFWQWYVGIGKIKILRKIFELHDKLTNKHWLVIFAISDAVV